MRIMEWQRGVSSSECDAGLGRMRGSNRVSRIIPIQRCCGQPPKRAFENSDSEGRRLERETALLLWPLLGNIVIVRLVPEFSLLRKQRVFVHKKL